jgi:hypothetical protein
MFFSARLRRLMFQHPNLFDAWWRFQKKVHRGILNFQIHTSESQERVHSFIKSPSTFLSFVFRLQPNKISFISISLNFTVGRCRAQLRLFNTLGLKSSDGHFSGGGNDWNDSILQRRVGGKKKTNDEK